MGRKSKNQLRRERKKVKKAEKSVQKDPKTATVKSSEVDPPIEVEKIELKGFEDVLKRFNEMANEEEQEQEKEEEQEEEEVPQAVVKRDAHGEVEKAQTGETEAKIEDDSENDGKSGEQKLSSRQLLKKYKIPLAILKAETERPEMVESTDADSPDPRLLVYLKTQHNVVPIPAHWKNKKGFLGGKRGAGLDRHTFRLPKFIADTGILQMRETSEVDESTMRQRMRERVQPKMGQLDMDFDKLYDAFFKYQTKPEMLEFGQLFEEHMENPDGVTEYQIDSFRPGILSKELRLALGMDPDRSGIPPPWAGRMKSLGPPPAYPYMTVEEATGIISVDKPMSTVKNIGEPIVKTPYGHIEPETESESESESEDEESEEDVEAKNFNTDVMLQTYGDDTEATVAPAAAETVTEDTDSGAPLYTVLKETKAEEEGIYGKGAKAYALGSETKESMDEGVEAPEQPPQSQPVKKNGKFHF